MIYKVLPALGTHTGGIFSSYSEMVMCVIRDIANKYLQNILIHHPMSLNTRTLILKELF